MAITGIEIQKMVEQKADKTYTGYYDPFKMNRLLRGVFYKVMDQKIELYRTSQKIADEIQPFLVYGENCVPYTNKLPTAAIIVKNITYVGSTVTITCEKDVPATTNDVFEFFDPQSGLSNLDIIFNATSVSGKTIVFTNQLGTPTGTYTANSASIYMSVWPILYYRFINAQLTFSDGKTSYVSNVSKISDLGSVFGQPTTIEPKVEIADNILHVLPSSPSCTLIKLFYFKKPGVEIDVNNSVYNYELVIGRKMIDHITDVAARNWAAYIKDPDSFRFNQMLITDNP